MGHDLTNDQTEVKLAELIGAGGEEDEMVGGQKHLITDLHQEPAWTWT